MTTDEKFMNRCIQLAINGQGFVSPNPMVGAVIVYNGKIIGEGFHRKYGEAHAEVNAIESVKNKSCLEYSTIYVSLEPCSHYGKTPPCSELIISYKFKRVVVGCLDPFHKVSGKGIEMIRNAGITVDVGILENESKALNKTFFITHILKRPYIYLKWAQSCDGFIDRERSESDSLLPAQISNDYTWILTHKQRSEVDAIMIGTNTAIKDNPSLTTRLWYGKNPLRIIIDKSKKISLNNEIFKDNVKTIIFTEKQSIEDSYSHITYIYIKFDQDLIKYILRTLYNYNVTSLMVEGGKKLLETFIDQKLWDEAIIETSNIKLYKGVSAPYIKGMVIDQNYWSDSSRIALRRI